MTPEIPVEAVVIGASAGAIEALSVVLPGLPERFDLPIIIVIHLPPDRNSIVADLFRAKSPLRVKEVDDKEPIIGGTIYFAPPDYHVLVEPDRRLSLSGEERVMYSRPSIDVLFESASEAYGPHLLGIVLTGGNSDGALGLRTILDGGGFGIIQAPASAYSAAMPKAAIEVCPEADVLKLEEIASFLASLSAKESYRR